MVSGNIKELGLSIKPPITFLYQMSCLLGDVLFDPFLGVVQFLMGDSGGVVT